MFKKSMDFGQAGDNIGCLLRSVKRDDIRRGQVIAQPGTVKTYKKFKVSYGNIIIIIVIIIIIIIIIISSI
jgi:translation elongation factor EF-Tu-like GTPase